MNVKRRGKLLLTLKQKVNNVNEVIKNVQM